MNMQSWIDQMIYIERKKALPILSFPAVQYLYVTVRELVADSNHQAIGMRCIVDNYDLPAALGYMDLSVEAEAFGADTVYSADEIPTIIGRMLSTYDDVDSLQIPEVGVGRTGSNIESIKKARILVKDRPIFAQCIGPFSLAGRLMNVNDILLHCYEEPDMVQKTLRKVSDFIIAYALAFKDAGADGIIIAEPLAGLLSPELIEEFSTKFVREIVQTIQNKHFITMYHNCGNNVPHLMDSIISTESKAFHFGDSVDMAYILERMPGDKLVLGNVSPARVFNANNTHHVRIETLRLLQACGDYKNFIISSGCDIPPNVDLDNVEEFMKASDGYYYRKSLRNAIS